MLIIENTDKTIFLCELEKLTKSNPKCQIHFSTHKLGDTTKYIALVVLVEPHC
ncbi:hypothetical protein [Bacillus sp. T33-2]|uniref:hypothetical protein n=1 Tax=Bacillus sp. T33-2 TaxID=2054168 RepID=UPI0015E0E4DD|nr:hypothetical protein [Bacillus sp. T33-2]